MEKRIIDLTVGLVIGQYLPFTIVVFGTTVHWVLIGLIATVLLLSLKKLGRFLWKKFIQAVKNELNKK